MSEWQDISTAPKTGEWIELWRGPCEYFTWQPLVFGRWSAEMESWIWPDGVYDPWHKRAAADELIYDGDFCEDGKSFTHWRPLSAPPQSP